MTDKVTDDVFKNPVVAFIVKYGVLSNTLLALLVVVSIAWVARQTDWWFENYVWRTQNIPWLSDYAEKSELGYQKSVCTSFNRCDWDEVSLLPRNEIRSQIDVVAKASAQAEYSQVLDSVRTNNAGLIKDIDTRAAVVVSELETCPRDDWGLRRKCWELFSRLYSNARVEDVPSGMSTARFNRLVELRALLIVRNSL